MSFVLCRLHGSSAVYGVLLLGLLGVGIQDAHGQLWLQTARVVSPVERGPVRVLLDTVQTVAERNDIRVIRRPDDSTGMGISDLQDLLIREEGIGIGSANHVFIEYRFTIGSGGEFEQEVAELYFVYRPGPNQNDIPILYVDGRAEWMRKILENKGTSLSTNEAALIPFGRHLDFSHVARHEQTQVVEIGGRTVREGFHEKKLALIQKVQRLIYDDP